MGLGFRIKGLRFSYCYYVKGEQIFRGSECNVTTHLVMASSWLLTHPVDGADVVQWKQTAGWGGSVRNMKDHLKKEWDSLLWIFAAFSILYYTEFASNLIFNPKIDW